MIFESFGFFGNGVNETLWAPNFGILECADYDMVHRGENSYG